MQRRPPNAIAPSTFNDLVVHVSPSKKIVRQWIVTPSFEFLPKTWRTEHHLLAHPTAIQPIQWPVLNMCSGIRFDHLFILLNLPRRCVSSLWTGLPFRSPRFVISSTRAIIIKPRTCLPTAQIHHFSHLIVRRIQLKLPETGNPGLENELRFQPPTYLVDRLITCTAVIISSVSIQPARKMAKYNYHHFCGVHRTCFIFKCTATTKVYQNFPSV